MSIILLGVAGGYLTTCGALYLAQTKLMYFPSKKIKQVPHWKTIANEHGKILGFENSHKEYDKTVIVFHGQTHNATFKTFYSKIFSHNTRVIIAEYPGFGHNHKLKISKKNIINHCNELIQHLKINTPNNHQFIIVGESLGTGIASEIAAVNHIDKLVLITPYSSIKDVVASKFWFVPYPILLKDNYDSIKNLKDYTGKVLFILSGKDKVISHKFSKKLINNVHTEKKEIFISEAGHFNWWKHMNHLQKEELQLFYR